MSEELMNFDLPVNQSSIIKVLRIGGGGSNAINHMWEQGIKDHQIQFVNMPATARISIFNSAGELVRILQHNQSTAVAPSIAYWDLKNEFSQLIAPGVYFYYIDSEIGQSKGKILIVL